MRIAVFGAGGVGGYFGGKLVQVGEEVTFIARGEHLSAMLASGLKVDSIKGDFVVKPVKATNDPRQVGEVDIVLLAVKAWDVPEAARLMAPMVGAHTGVIFLGNGVDGAEQIAAELSRAHTLGGLCRISVFIAGPGHIRHVGIEPFVAFGELDGHASPRVENLRAAFERAGVNVSVPADIQAAMWEKFAFIAAVSGVGAVTRAPAGAFRGLPGTRKMLEQAIEEIVRLAKARRIALPEDTAAKTMAIIDNMAPAVIASMHRDIVEGRPSELESQNGAVVRMAQEIGLPTPTHTFIYHSLLPQELKARRQLEY
jgi:2-dehydropantoate 2-reductase